MTTALKIPEEDDLLDAVAMDIGKEVAHYVETTYPEAVAAASSTFLLSVRNVVRNQIVSAVRDPKFGKSPAEWLKHRAKWRREHKAMVAMNRRKDPAEIRRWLDKQGGGSQ